MMRLPRRYITVSKGMAGWYALLVIDDEPWDTGIGRYASVIHAEAEGREWAETERLQFIGSRASEGS